MEKGEFKVEIITREGKEWTQLRFNTADQKIIEDYQSLVTVKPVKINNRYTYFELEGNVFKPNSI